MFSRLDPGRSTEELDKVAVNQLITMFGTVTEKFFKAFDRSGKKTGTGLMPETEEDLAKLHKILEKPRKGHKI